MIKYLLFFFYCEYIWANSPEAIFTKEMNKLLNQDNCRSLVTDLNGIVNKKINEISKKEKHKEMIDNFLKNQNELPPSQLKDISNEICVEVTSCKEDLLSQNCQENLILYRQTLSMPKGDVNISKKNLEDFANQTSKIKKNEPNSFNPIWAKIVSGIFVEDSRKTLERIVFPPHCTENFYQSYKKYLNFYEVKGNTKQTINEMMFMNRNIITNTGAQLDCKISKNKKSTRLQQKMEDIENNNSDTHLETRFYLRQLDNIMQTKLFNSSLALNSQFTDNTNYLNFDRKSFQNIYDLLAIINNENDMDENEFNAYLSNISKKNLTLTSLLDTYIAKYEKAYKSALEFAFKSSTVFDISNKKANNKPLTPFENWISNLYQINNSKTLQELLTQFDEKKKELITNNKKLVKATVKNGSNEEDVEIRLRGEFLKFFNFKALIATLQSPSTPPQISM